MGKFTIIYNRVDATTANTDIEWVKAMACALADHYPERMAKCLVMPADSVFRSVWKVAKVFFDPDTVEKIVMLATKEQLIEYVPLGQLLREVGGTDGYEFDASHVETREMVSEECRRLKRSNPEAQRVYEFV